MLTEAALIEAGRIDTPLGAVAMTLAAKLDDPGLDTGSSIAALARQHQASLERALDGSQRVETPLERMRRQRDLKAV